MDVESWCAVERSSNQNWTRSNRKHNKDALKSTVFSQEISSAEDRVNWSSADKPDNEKLAKRKHFPQKSKL